MNKTKQSGSIIAIIAMMFLYGMISFVTNLAAPIGIIWKNIFGGDSANTVGMLGNAMNFLAYFFMGIPAGKMLGRVGYKKTALIGIGIGLLGVFVQFCSGFFVDAKTTGFVIYLLGAFISGFCVCMLNTVVNPMLNLIGGGGNRGNQLNMIGGTLNSLAGMLTPLFVGALIGEVTKRTSIVNVNPVLYIAMGVFAAAFVILYFVPISDPQMGKTGSNVVFEHSAWNFRHFVLGAIAIFVYVGVEVGIPGTLIYYLSDTTAKGGGLSAATATAIAGSVSGTYWFLMLVGRFSTGFIADKVSSRTLMIITTTIAMGLIIVAMVLGSSITVSMPVFTGKSFDIVTVPISALLLVLCGLCTSVMWASIFNLATEGLGKYTASASGIFMMMVVGGGILPLIQNLVADNSSYMLSYIVPFLGIVYMAFYAIVGSRNVNKDISVD
ncbi:transporter, major facilitator family protein [Prevotella disiens JCM 6334 = ATCC 29426]|uniref:L-fucose permease n=2 Tax=Prevotella disiens TaxID=28130 RepID=A0A379EGP8_9BACT|nr:MFS transporter [Prevotella disiens]ERJ75805.1 transporter, major facilitator family protein [Prevotella disiens JCM 6334 = ATCC 29426]SUB97812.1 L-fucose permease [Prevotella disiens]